MRRLHLPFALALVLAAMPAAAQPIDDTAAWRTLAQQLEGGTTVRIQLRDGHRFTATFIGARDEGILVQRHTRIPVPVDDVPYTSIASMSRVEHSGMSPGKVTAIALGSAGAAIGAFFLILLATLD